MTMITSFFRSLGIVLSLFLILPLVPAIAFCWVGFLLFRGSLGHPLPPHATVTRVDGSHPLAASEPHMSRSEQTTRPTSPA